MSIHLSQPDNKETQINSFRRIYSIGRKKREQYNKLENLFMSQWPVRQERKYDQSNSFKLQKYCRTEQLIHRNNKLLNVFHDQNSSIHYSLLQNTTNQLLTKTDKIVQQEQQPKKFYFNKIQSSKTIKSHISSLKDSKDRYEELKEVLVQEKCRIYNDPYQIYHEHKSFRDQAVQLPTIPSFELQSKIIRTKKLKKHNKQDIFFLKYN